MSHLSAHGFSVLTVVTFRLGFGGPDIDPGGLAGCCRSGTFFTILEEIRHQLELYKNSTSLPLSLNAKI